MKARALWILPLVLCALGCGKDSRYVPVSGQVTMNDKPLANVIVLFQPVGAGDLGYGSSGRTDGDGRFTLKVIKPVQDGARIGKHKVQIYPPDGTELVVDPEVGSPDGAPPAKPVPTGLVPERYNDRTTLMIDVPEGGTDQANFALTRP